MYSGVTFIQLSLYLGLLWTTWVILAMWIPRRGMYGLQMARRIDTNRLINAGTMSQSFSQHWTNVVACVWIQRSGSMECGRVEVWIIRSMIVAGMPVLDGVVMFVLKWQPPDTDWWLTWPYKSRGHYRDVHPPPVVYDDRWSHRLRQKTCPVDSHFMQFVKGWELWWV